MAGSYSDNQPDFAWLDPYETKEFSQYWYPIFKIGAPTFANLNAAFRLDRAAGTFTLQTTRSFQNAEIEIFNEDGVYFTKTCSLTPNTVFSAKLPKLPQLVTVQITANGAVLAAYTEQNFNRLNMPPVIQDMPSAAEHARCALEHGGKNSLALGCLLLSLQKQGRAKQAADLAGQHLAADPLDHFIRLIAGADDFYAFNPWPQPFGGRAESVRNLGAGGAAGFKN